MPTANANTGSGARGALSYALQDKKVLSILSSAQVLEYNNVFGSSKDMGFQMNEISKERPAVQKPVLHVQINFHPDEHPTKKAAQKAIDSILKDIGIDKENHQYVVVQHRDKAHDHYHVVANRVGLDGSLMDDHRILDRLQVACDKVEKIQGLRLTENRTVIYDPSQSQGYSYVKGGHEKENKLVNDKNEAKKTVKEHVQDSLIDALRTVNAAGSLEAALHARGIETKFLENVKGVYGISFRHKEIAVKGSEVGFKWSEIAKIMEANKELARQQAAQLVRQQQIEATKPVIDKETASRIAKYIQAHAMDDSMTATVLSDQAIRTVMNEINPAENPWTTFSRFKREEETTKILHDFAEKSIKQAQEKKLAYVQDKNLYESYSKAIKAVDSQVWDGYRQGDLNFNIGAIFKKNGFVETEEHYIFHGEEKHFKVEKAPFDQNQGLINEQIKRHLAFQAERLKILAQQPRKIGFFEWITFQAKVIKAENEKLLEEKSMYKQTKELTYFGARPDFHGLKLPEEAIKEALAKKHPQITHFLALQEEKKQEEARRKSAPSLKVSEIKESTPKERTYKPDEEKEQKRNRGYRMR